MQFHGNVSTFTYANQVYCKKIRNEGISAGDLFKDYSKRLTHIKFLCWPFFFIFADKAKHSCDILQRYCLVKSLISVYWYNETVECYVPFALEMVE